MSIHPPLYGLILSGGQSSRMGQDKGLLNYHDEEQLKHAQKLLAPICTQVFISCRSEQVKQSVYSSCPLIIDKYSDCGALAGILSAFEEYPEVAWLVLACDMPQLDSKILEKLLAKRSEQNLATAFQPHTQNFPEPLCTIYEARAYKKLKEAYQEKRYAMVKLLKALRPSLIPIENSDSLININTPAEYLKEINNKRQDYF